ncbi:MAG: family 1 glycosylhydrolase [Galactobacter sp.]|uniref:family 1 glycosylhydrolase n=1 Tax=Galactobacter sp. TaxID=2676125 RepID=UPI00345DB055
MLGYCHWTLMNNFEWIFGYRPKLGLASVDRTSFRRTLKPSAVRMRPLSGRIAPPACEPAHVNGEKPQ